MLKVFDSAVTFSEFPDEIALCVNISGCPCDCSGCSEPWLKKDIGKEMTSEVIQELLDSHPDCTVFGLMGGDSDHADIIRIAVYVHTHSQMKVGFYSGRDFVDISLVPFVDYYKIGRWIAPTGKEEEWHLKPCGPLQFPFTNQIFFRCEGEKLIDCSYLFRKNPLSDLQRYIVGA